MARLYSDENIRRSVVDILRSLGHDVLTALEGPVKPIKKFQMTRYSGLHIPNNEFYLPTIEDISFGSIPPIPSILAL